MATQRGKRSTKGRSRPAAPSSKYDHLSVYDPTTRTVVASDGARTSTKPPTLAELSQLPGPLKMLDRLYACEAASEETIRQLAALANTTVADLEHRRLDFAKHDVGDCPRETPENRRRCMYCPWWQLTDETPF
jgi:hypothetical protein